MHRCNTYIAVGSFTPTDAARYGAVVSAAGGSPTVTVAANGAGEITGFGHGLDTSADMGLDRGIHTKS